MLSKVPGITEKEERKARAKFQTLNLRIRVALAFCLSLLRSIKTRAVRPVCAMCEVRNAPLRKPHRRTDRTVGRTALRASLTREYSTMSPCVVSVVCEVRTAPSRKPHCMPCWLENKVCVVTVVSWQTPVNVVFCGSSHWETAAGQLLERIIEEGQEVVGSRGSKN